VAPARVGETRSQSRDVGRERRHVAPRRADCTNRPQNGNLGEQDEGAAPPWSPTRLPLAGLGAAPQVLHFYYIPRPEA
jgi:hypothetical protein